MRVDGESAVVKKGTTLYCWPPGRMDPGDLSQENQHKRWDLNGSRTAASIFMSSQML